MIFAELYDPALVAPQAAAALAIGTGNAVGMVASVAGMTAEDIDTDPT